MLETLSGTANLQVTMSLSDPLHIANAQGKDFTFFRRPEVVTLYRRCARLFVFSCCDPDCCIFILVDEFSLMFVSTSRRTYSGRF